MEERQVEGRVFGGTVLGPKMVRWMMEDSDKRCYIPWRQLTDPERVKILWPPQEEDEGG